MDWKHARGINARHDAFKNLSGPMFHAIEEEIFKLPHFIKYIPVRDRARAILEKLWAPGGHYDITDFTSFECGFVYDFMMACEFQMYLYMLAHTPMYYTMLKICHEILGGVNVCTFKEFVIWVICTRMSGEMCTSLGNGWSNYCLFDFAASKSGASYLGFFEGDDGVARVWGKPIDESIFSRLGMVIKLKRVENLHEASFCGLLFDPTALQIITDPFKVLGTFAWGRALYRGAKDTVLQQLLRAKALSYLYQFPACPVVTAYARYAERMTRHVIIRKSIIDQLGWYERKKYLDAVAHMEDVMHEETIAADTRHLMEQQFGISYNDQLNIERMFDAKRDFCPITLPLDFPSPPVDFALQYMLDWPVGDENYIGEWWNTRTRTDLPYTDVGVVYLVKQDLMGNTTFDKIKYQ